MTEVDRSGRVQARLARMGFDDPVAACQALTTPPLDLWDAGRNAAVDADAAAVVSALARAADPDQAVRMLAELAAGAEGHEIVCRLRSSPRLRPRLLGVLGASLALAEHLVLNPSVALRLDDEFDVSEQELTRARLFAAVGADPRSPATGTGGSPAKLRGIDAVRSLRVAYRSELAVLAGADLAGEVPVAEVSERLADLAGWVLEAGLAVALAELGDQSRSCRLAVIAMGKTGARELNYLSDVDVVFVAEPVSGADGDPVVDKDGTASDVDGALSTATRLAARLMTFCGEVAWEVDAALRPEGQSGALVRTLASHEAYYRRWASTWEFQALLKARPVAGDPELGSAYVAALAPLVWKAAERTDFVTDVRAMRRRVVAQLPAAVAAREIKLGPGGLRDVEFAVQLLQLVHGRADQSLRVPATLNALAALRDGGFVGRDDALSLADAYAFLRTAEHRIQLSRLRRTHLVPDEPAALLALARAMGFRSDARGNAGAVWQDEWALHVREVRRLHEKLFYRPLLEAVARVPSEAMRLSPSEARRRLEALGYHDPAGALRHLEALTSGVSRRAAIQRALLPVMLSDLAEAPDPDAGLLAYRQVSDALGTTPWFLRLLRDEGAVARRLALVLGTSRYVANMLVRAPDALQMLADDAQLRPRRRADIETVMITSARRREGSAAAAHVIRSVRRQELLRIALGQLIGLVDDSAGRLALTELADATLAATLTVASATVAREVAGQVAGHVVGPGELGGSGDGQLGIDFAIIAMGRLGGRELGYGSDADVLFVYARRPDFVGSDGDASRQAHQVAERLREMLAAPSTDPPLLVDANLRPEGRSGPLVRSLQSYAEYYQRWSSVWEAQALLRARFCAGDAVLGERFVELIAPIRYPEGGLSTADVVEIRRIKGRIDAERLPRGADRTTHTKLGRGGLGDVEWTAQLLQLRQAYDCPALRTTNTLEALEAAQAAGLLSRDDAAALEAGWRIASRARDALMLARDRAEDQLPSQGLLLSAVGQLLGYQPGTDPGQIVDDYRRATRRARNVVESVFYDATD